MPLLISIRNGNNEKVNKLCKVKMIRDFIDGH